MVTICTASLTFNNCTFCPHSVFMCFVWISEQTAIISLYNINWPLFTTQTQCVYCSVRTVCHSLIWTNQKLQFISVSPCLPPNPHTVPNCTAPSHPTPHTQSPHLTLQYSQFSPQTKRSLSTTNNNSPPFHAVTLTVVTFCCFVYNHFYTALTRRTSGRKLGTR